METASKEPREADIVLSRVDVALARSQRIISSWLPQKSSDAAKSAGEDDQCLEDEKELGRDDSESCGVGWAPEASSSDSIRKDMSSLDRLRKQILGKRASNQAPKLSHGLPIGQMPMSRSHHSAPAEQAARPDLVSEDEDEGRAAAIASKKRKVSKHENGGRSAPDHSPVSGIKPDENLAPEDEDVQPQKTESKAGSSTTSSARRKPANFLDEVLAAKRKRKKKDRKDVSKVPGRSPS